MDPTLPFRDALGEHPSRGRPFMLATITAGLAAFAALVPRIDPSTIAADPVTFWLLAALALAGELVPIRAAIGGEVQEVGVSTTFGFAVLLRFGTAPAAAVFAGACLISDLVDRKPFLTAAFNVAQYVLSAAAAGAVWALLGAPSEIDARALGPIAGAALAFFVVNDLLTSTAIALSRGASVVRYVLEDLWFQVLTSAALFALSPVVIGLADEDPWLMLLVAVPVGAVYLGATASVRNTQLVARLREALEQEKELGRMKDDFVAVVSHELRTPLTSIQGYLKTMLQLGPQLEEEQKRSFLEAADRQSERLRRLIEQLLSVARLESDAEPLTLGPVSVDQVARHVVEELRSSAHGHTFDLRFDPALPLVETDEAKVHQILSNLVENALKYSPPDTRVTIRGARMADGVVVSVEDEGRGIPEEAHERIFDRFYQVDSSATRSVGGTGLGLYICRKLSELIGGRLWLERSGPEGTVFRLWIPGAPPSGRPGEAPASAPAKLSR